MKYEITNGTINQVIVDDFDPEKVTDAELKKLKELIYKNKIAVLKNQFLTPEQYINLSKRLGTPEEYYQPMYHHPEVKEIFVSSNIPKNGEQFGVPKTGKFWHADYAFMPKPFAFTLIYPQVIPQQNRGTFFIDMGKAYNNLSDELKAKAESLICRHSVRRYFKIRPTDIYKPISEVLKEIEQETPEVQHSCVFTHPITQEKTLYISEGFSEGLIDKNGKSLDQGELDELLEATGQKDKAYKNPAIHLQTFEKGDILIWDNRSLVHCALHTSAPEPAESFRITLHDEFDFYEGVNDFNQQIAAVA
ncbi:TauD/TfdA dioxygenase family protein [Aliikangiella maris]|uniref:TauD/TfdA family dioxygenase n=2 Tax=Aliikangiella maris TaxID=3162458 RepID=A0ABV2BRT2_9GAMM